MNLDDFITDILSDIDLTPLTPAIEMIILASIQRNFAEGGRFGNAPGGGGNKKWIQSKRAGRQGGKTLLDTGILRNSISVDVHVIGDTLQITLKAGTNYAAIHNFGGVIHKFASSKIYTQKRKKNGQFKKGTSYGQGSTTGDYEINIPARPFLVLQEEDLTDIQELIIDFIVKKIS